MNRKIKKLIAVCVLNALIALPLQAQLPTYQDESQSLEVRVKDALDRMTLEEKVALCHAQSKFSSPGVPRLGIPELWMSDGPHGIREEIQWNSWGTAKWSTDSCTAFPALTCLAATWNPEMAALYGRSIGEEARYRKKDVLLGPGVNIYRTPLNGRNFEYMGEDPYLASIMVVPYIQEVQKNGVATCVKHYVLNEQERWRGHINVELSDRALYEIYLPPFKAAVTQGGSWSLMGSYNKIRGQHGCHNELTLQKILKDEWKFDGCVITDWGGTHDTREAALNGLDIEMGSYTNGLTSESIFTYEDYFLAKPYLKMLREGSVPMSTINDKASRILKLIFRTSMNRNRPWGSFTSQAHYDACRTIGEEGIVLLKNTPIGQKSSTLLPLDTNHYQKILVVGENAIRRLTQGGGSSELKVKKEISPLAGLTALYGNKITYTQGYQSGRPMYSHTDRIPTTTSDSLRTEAIRLAKEADLVIYIGGLNKNHLQDCEAADRITYSLPFEQDKLIEGILAVNPQMVLVLMSGNAVEMPWINQVPAIVQAWYLGSESGNSLAHVLSGEINPSGKLPFSFPVKLEDNGAIHFGTESYPGDSINQIYKEDIFVGYRWHDTQKIPALFPFGHGLSYTTFEYEKPGLSAKSMSQNDILTLKIKIKNIGNRTGKEVVQLYISDRKSSLPRPIKELKGFQKIDLKPAEEKTISFTINKEMLSFFNDQNQKWIAEPGTFEILIGASSTDIRGKATFELSN